MTEPLVRRRFARAIAAGLWATLIVTSAPVGAMGWASAPSLEGSATRVGMPFPTLQETLTLESRRSQHTGGFCASDAGEWCTRLTLIWPEVVGGTSDSAAAAINRGTRDWLLRGVFEGTPLSSDALAGELQRGFNDLRKEFPGYAYSWWIERQVTVAVNTDAVFAVSMYGDMFTGGAHGSHVLTYANYDPATGTTIALTDVVAETDLAELNEIAEVFFRRQKNVEADAPLEGAGFWFDDNTFALNDNFLIGADGLTFFFNEYEIAAYAHGPTELHLPYADIDELVNSRFIAR